VNRRFAGPEAGYFAHRRLFLSLTNVYSLTKYADGTPDERTIGVAILHFVVVDCVGTACGGLLRKIVARGVS
jgi:hypothetical protein